MKVNEPGRPKLALKSTFMAADETCKAIFNLYSSRTSKSVCEAKQHAWNPKGERFANTQSPQHKAASNIFSRRAINAGLLLAQACSELTIPCSRLRSGSHTQHGRIILHR